MQDRRAPYKEKDVAKYINLCKDQMARKRGIISRSGEMVCRYLELDEEQFIHFREGGISSILENLDPVQFLMPTPETSNVIETLERSKSMIILNEVLNAASKTIKEFKSQLDL